LTTGNPSQKKGRQNHKEQEPKGSNRGNNKLRGQTPEGKKPATPEGNQGDLEVEEAYLCRSSVDS
jgi:hypothetical protein